MLYDITLVSTREVASTKISTSLTPRQVGPSYLVFSFQFTINETDAQHWATALGETPPRSAVAAAAEVAGAAAL